MTHSNNRGWSTTYPYISRHFNLDHGGMDAGSGRVNNLDNNLGERTRIESCSGSRYVRNEVSLIRRVMHDLIRRTSKNRRLAASLCYRRLAESA